MARKKRIAQPSDLVRMLVVALALGLAGATGAGAPATQPASDPLTYAAYGEPMDAAALEAEIVAVADALSHPEAHLDRSVRLRGVVEKVCQKAGCWMQLGDGELGQGLFIKFTCPINGRLIPMDAVGKTAEVFGELRIVEISEARARHYAEDDGKSPEEIAKIVGPQKMVTMASPSARVFGLVAEGE
ncbi:MAG: DUF4920 domain-containing protein [Planctomycetota bacterium]